METKLKPIPYEGKDKFIFISYAHKDSDVVLPIIDKMISDGYRVWYDDGIGPGTEWPEVIATHLNDCEICIAFLSKSYVDSFNCKREIDFAIRKRKQLLSVFLEETELPLGVEMQISTTQSIEYFKISKELFFEKLYASDFMTKSDCKGNETQNKDLPKTENKFTCPECGFAYDETFKSCPQCGCPKELSTNSDAEKEKEVVADKKTEETQTSDVGTPVKIFLDSKYYMTVNEACIYVEGTEKWRGHIGEYADIILDGKKKVEIRVFGSIAAVGGEWFGEIDPAEGTKYVLQFAGRGFFQKSKFTLKKADFF